MADQAHRDESQQFHRLIFGRMIARESDSVFCANSRCVLHVKPGDSNVEGSGNWAETPDGLIIGRQAVLAVLLCDQCAAGVRRGELTVRYDFSA